VKELCYLRTTPFKFLSFYTNLFNLAENKALRKLQKYDRDLWDILQLKIKEFDMKNTLIILIHNSVMGWSVFDKIRVYDL